MISESGRSNRAARVSSSFSACPKCRALKRPVFGSTRASASSLGTASERWISTSGATANGTIHGLESQKRRDADAERREHEVGRQALEAEQAGLARRDPARESEASARAASG